MHIDETIDKIDKGTHCIKGGAVENICGSATVKNICGSATVKYICDSATVMSAITHEWRNASSVLIKDNAVLVDRYNKTIIHNGFWKIEKRTAESNE